MTDGKLNRYLIFQYYFEHCRIHSLEQSLKRKIDFEYTVKCKYQADEIIIKNRCNFALNMVQTIENGINTYDVTKLTEFYKNICSDDFVYLEEYVGESAHPMKIKRNAVTYVGFEHLTKMQTSWSVSMPDMIFKYTNVKLEEDGKLIIVNWECSGTKLSNVEYSSGKSISYHPNVDSDNSISPSSENHNSNNVCPNISLFGTVRFYITEENKLYKMHYIVQSNAL